VFLRFEVALRWSGLIGLACGTSGRRFRGNVRPMRNNQSSAPLSGLTDRPPPGHKSDDDC
jgi:hypothetical protein